MLPGLGPRVTITPNTGGSLSNRCNAGSSRPPASSEASRSRRSRALPAPGCCAATLAQPTRKSFDGIKPLDSAGLRPEQLIEDIQTLPVASSASELQASLPHSVSAASLASDSALAVLLGATPDAAQGVASTPLVFGSFPPVTVPLPTPPPNAASTADATATEQPVEAEPVPTAEAASAAAVSGAEPGSKAASKLKATSHEFYPQAYLAAAAALAASTISSSISRSSSPPAEAPEEVTAEDDTHHQAAAVAAEAVAAEAAMAAQQTAAEPQQEQPVAVYEAVGEAHSASQQQLSSVEQQQQQAPQQQQQYWIVPHHQHWQQPATHQQWLEQQQQWVQWQQHQQLQQHVMPMPVLVPIYVQQYPYPHYVQQHPQVQMVPMLMPADPAATAAASAAAPGQLQHAPQQQQQQLQQVQVCPPSPGGFSLPADTCSLMSAHTPAATPTAWQQHSGPSSSSRPGSSASSVASMYTTTSSRRHRQQQLGDQASREAGTVTVSALSCVKDAAGALAKVVTRHGSCVLLSLVKPGEAVAQATHVAAKSLAVARFYVNAHMAAAGAAGIDAAAALTGVEATPEAAAAAAAGPAASAVDDEVVFMPFQQSSSSRQSVDAADVPLGFLVAKASTKDLAVQLPPPVGIPACMQERVQQQQQHSTPAAAGGSSNSSATLLKAGANTDVNKLSNAVIHNILGSGHVAMQLAGAAACHVAMRALIKARDRLMRKFKTDIVATASFANEDTSSSIGRSTVFLRLDVMRSTLLQRVVAASTAVVQAVEAQQQQQQQLAGAMA